MAPTNYVLPDNTQMLRLGRKLGFRQRMDREMEALELSIELGATTTLTPQADQLFEGSTVSSIYSDSTSLSER
jgi:hypothetical protein